MSQPEGVVLALHLTAKAGAQMKSVEEAAAVAGRGLVGDRYCESTGRYSERRSERREQPTAQAGREAGRGAPPEAAASGAAEPSVAPKRQVTFIASEDLAALESEGVELTAAESRRNVLTGGVELLQLIGRRFSVGGAVCEGVEECTPCSYLESLTRPGVLRALGGRGGLRAGIVSSGTIRVGDPVIDLGAAVTWVSDARR